MIILNFAHLLTQPQIDRIKELTARSEVFVHNIPSHLEHRHSFSRQIDGMLTDFSLSAEHLQGEDWIVVLPSLNTIAALLLAELHGRIGYFPSIVRLRPIEGSVTRQFEVAEIIDLQSVRDRARQTRFSEPDSTVRTSDEDNPK